MSLVRYLERAFSLLAILGLLGGLLGTGLLGAGCARPYAGPKTLAALGVGLLAAGSTTWVAGDRENHGGVAAAGMATTALGAIAVFVGMVALAFGVEAIFRRVSGRPVRV